MLCFVDVDDFNARNKCLTAKLLKQGCDYHKFRKAFSKFYRRHHELVSKFDVFTPRPIGTRILWRLSIQIQKDYG